MRRRRVEKVRGGGMITFPFLTINRRFRHVLFKVYEIAEESYITAQTATRLKTRGVNKIWLGFPASLRMCRLATTCAHPLCNYSVKHGVLVTLGMTWFCGVLTLKSQGRTRDVSDYRMQIKVHVLAACSFR